MIKLVNDDCLNYLSHIKEKRDFIGIELESKYYQIAKERINKEEDKNE